MTKEDPSKAMIIVAAPKGTTLEVGEEERGNCTLKMNATGKGAIRVFSCKVSEGVKELDIMHG
jgi:hypothetical protein